MSKSKTTKGFEVVGNVLDRFKIEEDKYISREFQQYGYDLAKELGDLKSTSLYIKIAKETPRGLIESARSFVRDAYNARSKPRLFMWKLKQLRSAKTSAQKKRG